MTDFHTSEFGLYDEQVLESTAKYGKNNIIDNKPDSVWYRLRRAFINPFSIVLFVLGIIFRNIDSRFNKRIIQLPS